MHIQILQNDLAKVMAG